MGKFNMLKSAYDATVSAVSKTIRKSFKGACAVTVSALLVMQGLVPSVAVIADEIDSSDETEAVYEVVASPATIESDDVVIEIGETEETVDENVDSVPADETAESEDPADVDTNPPIEEQTEATEAVETEADATEATEAETEETTETDVEEVPYVEFDHLYSDVDIESVTTSDLLVQTDNADVFTYNTNVVSNYDDVYVISFGSVEEARFAYSYYADKVESISDMSSVISIATDDNPDDTADLSDLNNGEDAISNLNDISVSDYSGYIALIDTGANADVNFSVVGEDTSDSQGHGTDMLGYIREEHPDAKVMSIKVFNGSTTDAASVYAGIMLAIESNVSVINLSFTGLDNEQNAIVRSAIEQAVAQGIVVIGAAGNQNSDANNYIPGAVSGVVAIGAINDDGTKNSASNYNADYYVVASSTSEAAARYSGIYVSGELSDKVRSSYVETSVTEPDVTPTSDNDDGSVSGMSVGDIVGVFDDGSYWIVTKIENGSFDAQFVPAPGSDFEAAELTYGTGGPYNADGLGIEPNTSGVDYGTCDFTRTEAGYGEIRNFSGTDNTNGSWHIGDFIGGDYLNCECEGHGSNSTQSSYAYAMDSGTKYYKAEWSAGDVEDDGKIHISVSIYISNDTNFGARSWSDKTQTVRWRVRWVDGGIPTIQSYKCVLDLDTDNDGVYDVTGIEVSSAFPAGGLSFAQSSGIVNSVMDKIRDHIPTVAPYKGIRNVGSTTFIGLTTDHIKIGTNATGTARTPYERCEETQVYFRAAAFTTTNSSAIGLTKITADGYDCVTDGNSCYSLDGTEYTLYSDADCTNAVHTFSIGADGHTDSYTVEASNFGSTYYLKETVAGPGYALDTTIYKIEVDDSGAMTGSTYSGSGSCGFEWHSGNRLGEIVVSDTPLRDAFVVQLQKVNDVNPTATQATMDQVTFHICYYAADYGITDTLGIPTDDFYVTYSNPASLRLLRLKQFAGEDSAVTVTGDNDYLSGVYAGLNSGELPLGTYTIQESTAPTGFVVNSTLYRIRIYESGDQALCQLRNATTGEPISVINVGNEATAQFKSIHEPHTYAYYSLIKDLPDTAINNNRAGFEYNMYWKKADGTYVLFATGTSQSDGRVYWTYQMANYYHLSETDYETKTLLTGTRTYTLEVVAGETYEVRETIKDLPYGNQNTGLTYTSITPSGWTRGNGYFYKSVVVAAGTTANDSLQRVSNDWNYGSLSVHKTKPAGDLFDLTKVSFTLYTYVNNVRKVVATGTVDANGNITWTRVDTNGYGVYQAGNYNNRTSINTVANLPIGTYYVEETWDKVYIDTLDPDARDIWELWATNNTTGWTTSSDDESYVSYTSVTLTNEASITLGAPMNDLHYQWFGANKTVTDDGDVSTIQFELYYTSGATPVLVATGYAETAGKGTYPIIWDGYLGASEYRRNNDQEIVLPEGNYEIREIVPETYYQNGRDNVPYSYMVPSGWQNHVGANGHSDYFYKTFTASNNANTVISSVNPTNDRIEAELTVRKIEQTNAPEREFTFEIYYRGNEAEPMNVGVFTEEYLLDTITVTTVDGSGYATLDKIPEGWYEVIEVDNDGWEAIWMNSATNTAAGKLVHASSENLTVSDIVINDNIKLFGMSFSGILINNMISPTVEVPKIDSWTNDVVASDITHPQGVHLTFYLYEDRDGDGALSDLELSYGYVARIDGDDDGSVKFENLRAGKYIVHEVATIDGYYLTAADTAFELSEPELTVIEMGNMPYTETVKVTKVDNETDELLSGAVFTVFVDTNDNGEYDAEDQIAQMWNDANGNKKADDGELMDAVLIETSKGVYESYALHFNDGRTFGNRYFLVETEAPENYFFVNEDGTFSDTSRVVTFTVDKKDTTAADFQVGTNEFTFRNQTGTVFAKKTNQNGEFLSGAEFTVYADADCTQVIGVLTENTAEQTYSYRGLGLGTYYLKETAAPEGFEIDPNAYEFEVTTTQVHPVVMNFMAYKYNVDGAFVDVEIHTTANDPMIADPDDSYSIIARESEETTIVDRVYFDGLIIGNEYQVTGDLVYQADFDGHKAGDIITTQTVTFVAGDESDEAQSFTVNEDGKTIEGYIDVVFTVDTTKITTTIVAFETIKTLPEGTVVGVHASLNDVPQTKVIPRIGTTIADQQTMINQTSLGGTVTVVDEVAYENLIKGETYTLNGVLVDSETGDEVATGTVQFTADGEIVKTVVVDGQVIDLVSGTANVTFELDVTDLGGRSFVAFEYLFMTGVDGEAVQIASHEDLDDEGQTIHVPEIKTHANVPEEELRLAPAIEDYTFTDTVMYENLIPGKTYTVTGVLMNADTGEVLVDEDGNPYEGSTEFTAGKADGSVDVTFVVNTKLLQGTSVVVFEDLYYNGIHIATHSDLKDKDQTFDIPELHTTASTAIGNTVEYSDQAVVTDRVFYSNLVPGKEYEITGTLVVKASGESVKDAEGHEVTATVTFTPETTEGYVDVVFTFDATVYVGETLVVFETLSHKGIEYVAHADLEDEDQTVYVPEIHTTASTAIGNVVEYSEQATVTDRVFYTGLTVGKTYEVTGTLVVKSTGDTVRDANGEAVIAMAAFTPETSDGFVDVTFVFDATLYQGEALVAFETLTYEGIVYAVHTDLEDEDQTVYVPEIHTTATDANGNKVFQATESATIVDEIAYENLEPGTIYRADGVLMDKSTGTPLLINGQEVHASAEFVPETPNGTVTVTFTFNASALAGKSLVVFENVYDISGAFVVNQETGEEVFDETIETLVATHEDLEDEGQTVTITEAPKTGDTSDMSGLATGAMIAAGVAAVAGAAFVALRKKNKSQGGEA